MGFSGSDVRNNKGSYVFWLRRREKEAWRYADNFPRNSRRNDVVCDAAEHIHLVSIHSSFDIMTFFAKVRSYDVDEK